MTNVEKKMLRKRTANFKLAKLAERKIKALEKMKAEAYKDKHFADSWEQAVQISDSINKMDKDLDFLCDLKRKFLYGFEVILSEYTRFKNICRRKGY